MWKAIAVAALRQSAPETGIYKKLINLTTSRPSLSPGTTGISSPPYLLPAWRLNGHSHVPALLITTKTKPPLTLRQDLRPRDHTYTRPTPKATKPNRHPKDRKSIIPKLSLQTPPTHKFSKIASASQTHPSSSFNVVVPLRNLVASATLLLESPCKPEN